MNPHVYLVLEVMREHGHLKIKTLHGLAFLIYCILFLILEDHIYP